MTYRNRVKKTIGFLFMLVALLAGVSYASAEPVTIGFWVVDWNLETQKVLEENIIPAFEERNPGIKVDLKYITWGNFDEQILTAFAGGTAPDIIQRGADEVIKLATKNQAINLDKYLDRWGHRDDFISSTFDGVVTYGDGVYGIPALSSPRILIYRKDLFREVGLDPNAPPQDWDDFRTYAIKLTKRTPENQLERLGFALHTVSPGMQPAGYYQQWLDFFWQNGGEVATPDGKLSTFNTDEGVEALQYYVDLYQALIPAGTAALPSEMIPSFPAGRIGMKIDSRYAVVEMEQYAPELIDEIGVSLPIGRKRRAGVVYSDFWTITTQAKHPDEAWRFLEFLMEPENLVAYNATMGFLPPRESMEHHPYIADDWTAKIFMEALVDGHVLPYPVVVNGREFGEFLGEEIEMAIQMMKSPSEALIDAEERVNDSLKRAWRSLERK